MKESYKNMPLSPLLITLRSICAILDSRKDEDISISEMGKHIKGGTVLEFIASFHEAREIKSVMKQTESSPLKNPYEDFDEYYVIHLQDLLDVYGADGSERRIKNSGMCLLLVWTIEIIQMGSGWKASTETAGLNRD